MDVDPAELAQVFAGLQVFVDPAVGGRYPETLPPLLAAHGATPPPPPAAPPTSPNAPRFALPPAGSDQIVVVVTDGLGFPEWETEFKGRRDEGRWAVTPAWVLQCVKSELRQAPQYFSPDPHSFFSGVCVCCSDLLSEGDRQAIGAGVLAYGGQSKVILTKEVTHLVTPSATGEMYDLVRAHPEARIAPVLPHWVDTCIAYATLVAFTPFEFPEPAVLAHPTAAGGGAAAGGGTETMSDERRLAVAQMVGKAEFARRAADAGEGGASGAGRVWAGRKVRFGADLGVGAARLESWVARVEDGGGQVVDDVREADVYIGQYRDGREFNQAVKLGKTIGNLPWFLHVCSTGALRPATQRLLHYPVPREPIPEFASVLVTLTNYTGETRDYVRTLIELMGGRFTPDFSRANTHVIASIKHGNKIARALQWEKPVVNHLWAEACFAQWRLVPVTARPEFTHFAEGTNLVALVGTRGLDEGELKHWLERAKAAADDDDDDEAGEGGGGTRKEAPGPEPRYESALLPPPVPRPKARPQPSIAVSGPSIIAASYETTSAENSPGRLPARPPLPAGGEPSPAPSPLRTSTTRAAALPPATAGGSSTANLVPPPSSSSKNISSDDSLALRSPSQRRPAAPVPPLAREPSSPEKENSPLATRPAAAAAQQQRAESPSRTGGAAPPPSSHTDRSESSSPTRPTSAALGPTTAAQDDADRSSPAPPAGGPSKPTAAASRAPPSAVTPAFKSTATAGRPPSSTPRGLDNGAILPSNSRRKAADAAVKRLHDEIMPDVLVYEKAKRNKTLMTGGRTGRADSAGTSERSSSPDKARGGGGGKGKGRAATEDTDGGASAAAEDMLDMLAEEGDGEVKVDLRRPASTAAHKAAKRKHADDGDESDGPPPPPTARVKGAKKGASKTKVEDEAPDIPSTSKGKRARSDAPAADSDGPSPVSVHILTTQAALTGPQQKWIKGTGAKIVTKPSQCTFLVAGGISRTEKFLCALAVAPTVVDKSWIAASVKAGHFVDPKPHLLKDPESETRYGIALPDLLRKAEAYKTGAAGQVGLLSGVTFYATRQVETEFDVLKRIVEAHKGKLSNAIPRFKTFAEDPTKHVLISCRPDRDLWQPLKDQGVSVYTRELILGGLIRQEMDFDKDLL